MPAAGGSEEARTDPGREQEGADGDGTQAPADGEARGDEASVGAAGSSVA
jgi:hypothetical protein